MAGDRPTDPRETAVEHLTAFGLSTYAARTYVALVSLDNGTAKDVSDVADVPRTRVYDAVSELQSEGLVDVQHATPKRFWPVSSDTTGRRFRRDYTHRASRLTEALADLEPSTRTEVQRGVWTVTGRDAVTDRVVEFVDGATDEVVFMTVETLLTDPIVESLRAASARGVSIRLAGMADAVEGQFGEAVPDADTFESIWEWSDTPAGRLLMVDRTKTLVSVRVEGDGANPPEPLDETAIWGAGDVNGLVVVLKALFTWQLDGNRE